MASDWFPLWLSLRYAGASTMLAALVALPLAWVLVHRGFPGSDWVDAAASLPLILPPAVLVYYLLASLGRWPLHFTWHAAVAVSTIYTLPVLLRRARASLAAVDPGLESAARVLGAGEWRCFWRVTLPLQWRALLGAVLVGFVRSFADFLATAVLTSDSSKAWLMLIAAGMGLAFLYSGNRASRREMPA